jgi:hypothetical protein
VSKGIKTLVVDGKPISGHIVPFFNDGKSHEVEVLMGAADASTHVHPASAAAMTL